MRNGRWLSTLAALPLLACGGNPPPEPGASSLEGLWQTEGYGHVVEISGARARFHEVTAVSCIPNWEMTLAPPQDPAAEATMDFPEAGFQLAVYAGDHADERWLGLEALASRRRLARIDEMPEVCASPTPSDPLSVFDTYWQSYADHYPFFEMKGIDWAAVRDRERPNIDEETTGEELFEVLRRMIEPLEDAHTFLAADDLDLRFAGRRPDPDPLDDAATDRVREIVGIYLAGPIAMRCNDQIGVGRLEGGVRYLVLSSFSGFGQGFRAGMDCLDGALDLLLEDADEIPGVVIDVRINSGGADPYGLAIASRFAREEYLAYTKETRNDPGDPASWSDGQPSMVRPSDRASFAGPVALLTGSRSVSAAETFTMALMGRRPRITRIGSHTQGVFSDVLGRRLPNGWSFGLPNERFLTADGRSFDGPGIPPHVETAVFPPADLAAGVDSALETALETLAAAGR